MRKLLVPLSIIALTVIGCQKNDAHENVLHDEILAWAEDYYIWDNSGIGDKPTPLLISKERHDFILNDANANDEISLRSRAMLLCFGVVKGFEYNKDRCDESLTKASEAGDISTKVLERMEGNDFYEDAAKNGNTFAQIMMIEIGEESDSELPWLEMSLDNGNVRAIFEIWLLTREQDAAKATEKTIARYEKVAREVGNLPSQNLINLRRQAVLGTGDMLLRTMTYERRELNYEHASISSEIKVRNAMEVARGEN